MIARTRSAPEHRRGRRAAGHRFLERKRGRAKGAFGRHAADDPVRAAAAGTVVDFAIVIDGVIAPRVGVEGFTAGLDRTQHGAFLRNHLTHLTSGESLGFIDNP